MASRYTVPGTASWQRLHIGKTTERPRAIFGVSDPTLPANIRVQQYYKTTVRKMETRVDFPVILLYNY